jgi:S-formylglutathione hydrolase
MDELIAAKTIPPVILVMPNARNAFLGSYYLNSPVTGRWADFIADEIVSKVDAEFRTMRGPSHRAVMGHSMGGFGAIHFGMTRPDVFSAVYAMSPCCLDAVGDVGGGNVAAWSTALRFKSLADAQAALQRGDFYPMAIIGILSAMAPKPGALLNVEFPYRLERNELVRVHPAFENLMDQFPVNQVKKHRASLSGLRLLALDAGYDDQFAHIPPATMSLSRALYDAGVPHRLDVYAGDHRQQLRERMRTIVFPAVTAVLDR